MDALESALDDREDKQLRKLHGKMVTAFRKTPPPAGMPFCDVEAVLIAHSNGRYVPWVAGNPSALLRMWYSFKPEPEQLEAVAKWMAKWPPHMTVTFGSIVRKWPDYVARAGAVPAAPSRKAPAGFVDGVDW